MRAYTITVNGKTYDVEVAEKEVDGGVQIQKVTPVAAAPKAAAPAPSAAPAPAAAPAAPKAAAPAGGSGVLTAPMVGKVLSIPVKEGDAVKAGQVVLTFEAMKMENEVMAPAAGTVQKIFVSVGADLEAGQQLVQIG